MISSRIYNILWEVKLEYRNLEEPGNEPLTYSLWKEVHQGCILSPCLFNLYAKYIMWNAGLGEAQAEIKIAGRNINNLRYTDDTPLWQKAKKN